MKHTNRLSFKIVPVVALAMLMAGCTMDVSYEESLISEAAPGETFALPQQDSPMESWELVAVVCPYSSASADLLAPIRNIVDQLDTDSEDHRQWLVFGQENDAQSVELNRSKVDFCFGKADYSHTFSADQQWSVQKGPGGVMELSPSNSKASFS